MGLRSRFIGRWVLGFESTYQACLAHELRQQGLEVEREKELPVVYKRVTLDCGYRIDLLIQHTVIVELKAVQELTAIHEAQILSYLRLSGCPVGLLINFNVRQLTEGIKRFRISMDVCRGCALNSLRDLCTTNM